MELERNKFYAGTSKAPHKAFQQRGASPIRKFSFIKAYSFCMEIIAEDWVHLQSGMHPQLSVLQHLFIY